MKENRATELRKQAEARLKKSVEKPADLYDSDPQGLIHELRVAERTEALRESEEKYRNIFEGASDGIIACDLTTGKFLFVNKRMCKLMGYSEQEILKLGVKDIHQEKDLPYVLGEFNKMASGEKTETRDIPVLKKDKSIIYCDIGSSFLNKTTLLGFFRDVTERKRAAEALLHAKEQWERTFASVPDMIAIIDNNHKVVRVNESMAKRLGRKPEECVGLPCYEAVHGTAVPPAFCPHSRTIKDGREHVQDIHEERLGMDLQITTTPLFDEQGKIIASVHVAHDITERTLAKEALQKAKDELEFRVRERTAELARLNRLYSVLSKTNEAIVRIHEPLKLFEEICHIAVKEGAFRLAWIGLLDPDTRAVIPVASHGETAYLNGIRIIASDVPEGKGPTGRAVVEQKYFICSDIENDPVMLPWRDRALNHGIRSSSSFPIIHSGSEVIGAFTIYSDKPSYFTEEEINLLLSLTENISFAIESIENEKKRHEIKEALRILNEGLEKKVAERTADLEAVNKELEAYSYTVSHDLRAPLRSIEGFSRAIMEDYADKLDATGRDYFLRVTSASRRMMQLIDALLTMSRLTQNEIKEKVVNLSDAVRVIAHELKQSQPERAVEFVIAERVSANGDPDMLRIVLENLLDNAWKFTSKHPAANIEFGVTRIDDRDIYFVRDDGAGFNMEFAGKLFNPFRRFHNESEFPGIGIGLATVHKIIIRHGGKIWAESAPEKGVSFYFTLE
jgi:PAS domain S-box-containing protein